METPPGCEGQSLVDEYNQNVFVSTKRTLSQPSTFKRIA